MADSYHEMQGKGEVFDIAGIVNALTMDCLMAANPSDEDDI